MEEDDLGAFFGFSGWVVRPLVTLVAVISWTDLQHIKIPKTRSVHKCSFLLMFHFPLGEDEDDNISLMPRIFFLVLFGFNAGLSKFVYFMLSYSLSPLVYLTKKSDPSTCKVKQFYLPEQLNTVK